MPDKYAEDEWVLGRGVAPYKPCQIIQRLSGGSRYKCMTQDGDVGSYDEVDLKLVVKPTVSLTGGSRRRRRGKKSRRRYTRRH